MSSMRRQCLAIIVTCLLYGASACTTDEPVVSRPPDPSDEPTTTTTMPPPPSTPPPITRPLDASGYREEKACDLITGDQVEAYGLVPRPQSTVVEPKYRARCDWDSKGTIYNVHLNFYYNTDHLGRIYRRELEYWLTDGGFTQAFIAGQPAAKRQNPLRPALCRLAVGLTVSETIELAVVNYKGDGCQFGEELAAGIVRNLGG
jgi:hypothetical protein